MRIRRAEKKDVSVILGLIRQLAEFEKLLHEVVADEASLTSTLFGANPVAEVLLAEKDNQAVGFALFFHNYSTFLGRPGLYLEDLFVKPEFRGQGIGQELFDAVLTLAKERNCGRMEWSVLDWNENAIQFYKNRGAQPMDEWTVYRISL